MNVGFINVRVRLFQVIGAQFLLVVIIIKLKHSMGELSLFLINKNKTGDFEEMPQ